MCFDEFWKRSVAFGLTLAFGLFAAAFFYEWNFTSIFRKETKPVLKSTASANNGMGDAACNPTSGRKDFEETPPKNSPGKTKGVKIVSKPRADYTNEARANYVQGKVVLRVTFAANGTIGAISTISGLPDGLTESATEAAKKIKFEPARRGGAAYSVTKPVEYKFSIY